MTMSKPIETRYAGCRFRSRLEARWAVFFDTMNIPWEYEPQGYTLSNGRNYLPDFLLPDCGTWIEVKGSAAQLDIALMERAALDLPAMPTPGGARGPKLMILGPIPFSRDHVDVDYAWRSVDPPWCGCGPRHDGWEPSHENCHLVQWSCHSFGLYIRNLRPWWQPCALDGIHDDVVSACPVLGDDARPWWEDSRNAYAAARSARFEHGEQG